jgi:hypothetical protein
LSPILVRPVREQLEHDRVIRLLQAKYKRKFEVAINPGNQQAMPVGAGPAAWYPDLVLQSQDRGRKLVGVVEVETAESVNNLEAMSQWTALSRLKAAFHLYVPSGSIDTARRLCTDLQIPVAEVWAYHWLGDQMRFTLVQRSGSAENGKSHATGDGAARPRPAARAATARPAVIGKRAAATTATRPSRRTAAATPARKTVAKSRSAASGAARRTAPAKTTSRQSPARKPGSRAQKRK